MIATNREEVKQAIGLHGLWKARLLAAVTTGQCHYRAEQVGKSEGCEFGRWLASIPPDAVDASYAEKTRVLHQRFHVEAAQVLRLVESGEREAASRAIEPGSGFARSTAELTLTLLEWSRAA